MITTEFSYIFYNKQGHKFEISLGVVEQLRNYAQNLPRKREAGGVILGRFIIDTEDVIVDKITRPMRGDKQSLFRFFRSRRLHQEIISKEWKASDGKCNYLGEWHTHPDSDPEPSLVDRVDWKRKLFFDQFDSDCLYFVIVGTERINAWQGYRKTLEIEQLTRLL